MEKRKFTGYHGTNNTVAKQIIRTNFAKNHSVGWLGTGVYFYDDDQEMARYWAEERHKGKIPKVIKSDIEIPENEVFDMTESYSRSFFHVFRKKLLQEQIKKRKRKILVTNNQDLDGKIYNAIADKKGYRLIRAETYTYQDEERYYGFSPSRVPNSTELCLRHIPYIRSKEIV